MKIVIDIPEQAYRLLQGEEGIDWLGAEHILNAVANGTLLPKGHSNLIDADKAFEELNKLIDMHDKIMTKCQPYQNTQIPGFMWETVCERTVIIEAERSKE